MISRLRAQLGPAGFVIAVIALVAALAGGAYAASGGLSGKQKKEVKSIAKTEAKKVAIPGPVGPAGAPGAAGVAGKDGTNGTNGTNGAPGKSIEVGTAGAECSSGGVTVQVAGEAGTKKPVCNGETGYTDTLPPEKTEMGVWRFTSNGEVEQYVPISFSIPLSAADAALIAPKVWNEEAPSHPAQCTGTPNEPKASPGFLCLYIAEGAENNADTNTTVGPQVYPPAFTFSAQGVGQSGAFLLFENATQLGKHVSGSFAVTAPEP